VASNFHDMNGCLIVGFDWHLGVQCIPLIFGPFPFWEVNVMHPFWAGPDPNDTVLINGTQSVKDGHEPLLLWPHFPLTPMNLVFPLDVLMGSQKCWLPKLSVQAEGKPMTITVVGPISTNLDCHTPAKLPSSFVLQTGTVETTPSIADIVWGVGRAAVAAAVDYFFYKLGGGYDPKKAFTLGADAVIENIIGRFIPFPPNDNSQISRILWEKWAISNVFGGSPQGAAAAFFDAVGLPTGVPGQSWQSLVGSPQNVTDTEGNQAPTAASVGRKMLENLFPPLKLLPEGP